MRVVVGIDPGISGAIAWIGLRQPGDNPVLLDAMDIPLVSMKSGKTVKKFVNMPGLADALQHPAIPTPSAVWIEQVNAMPGQGVTSMFRFGFASGAAEGVCAGLHLPVQKVMPKKWQADFRIIGGDKDKSRMIASQLFPNRADLFKRKKDNGRSDATLIALHGLRAA